jgi:hypothetical protein
MFKVGDKIKAKYRYEYLCNFGKRIFTVIEVDHKLAAIKLLEIKPKDADWWGNDFFELYEMSSPEEQGENALFWNEIAE